MSAAWNGTQHAAPVGHCLSIGIGIGIGHRRFTRISLVGCTDLHISLLKSFQIHWPLNVKTRILSRFSLCPFVRISNSIFRKANTNCWHIHDEFGVLILPSRTSFLQSYTGLQFPLFFTSASTTDQDFFNPFSNVHRLLFLLLLSINNVDEKSPAPQRIYASFLPSSLPHCLILSFFPFLPVNPFPCSLPSCLSFSFFTFLPFNPFPSSLQPFWAAAPKGTKSCRTQGDFCLSVLPFVPPGHLRPEVCPLRPEIYPFRPEIYPLRP